MKATVLIALFIGGRILFAQVGETDGSRFYCSYYGEAASVETRLGPAAESAHQAIQKIVDVVGLRANFEIRSANVPNASAVIYKGERYILYNPSFINDINKAARTNWAGISILAHEIGHHLNGHTLGAGGSRPEIELEADEFSGFVLRKMGASLTQAQLAMKIAASQKASHTHPARSTRLTAIASGWKNADNQINGKTETLANKEEIKKPVIVEQKPDKNTALSEKFIAWEVHFNADATGSYFITIRNNLVKVVKDKLYIVGRLSQSNKSKYPYMLYDKEFNYLYVTKEGAILNAVGNRVGRLVKRGHGSEYTGSTK